MSRFNFIFLFIILSLALHVFLFSYLDLDINAKKTPLLYAWPGIIGKNDLFAKPSIADLPSIIDFSFDDLRRDYFSDPKIIHPESSLVMEGPRDIFLPSKASLLFAKINNRQFEPKSIYLWEKQTAFSVQDKEKVTFRAFVSPHGKILFIYPQKLAINSSGNLLFQEYIHKANLFLNDKFFWTKVEGVVK